MQYEVIRLRELFPALAKEPLEKLRSERAAYVANDGFTPDLADYQEPTLTVYAPDNSPEILKTTRPSVVVCPGGGYRIVSFREAEPVALKLTALGYNVFLLHYSVAPVRYPAALLELAAAFSVVRSRAKQYHVDPDKIALAGFSAGGHLAASLGTLWREPFLSQTLGVDAEQFRPNALILSYPVLTAGKYAHKGSFEDLFGKDVDEADWEPLSLEKRVSADTPPTFLWHTFADQIVPVENSLLFAGALRAQGISFELHIYPEGPHGLSLCSADTAPTGRADLLNAHDATWFSLCDQWLHVVFGDAD